MKNIELDALSLSDDRYIKTKIRTYGDNFYTIFCSLNVLEDGVECKPFTIFSIGHIFVSENKYYPRVYVDMVLIKLKTHK